MESDIVPVACQRYQTTIKLTGPTNPLEMRMYGKVKSLSGCVVNIDNDSVNSVLLDDQPEDCHERVVVAAQVTKQNINFKLLSAEMH